MPQPAPANTAGTSPEPARREDAGGGAGPHLNELIAPRAELKRVEGELKRAAEE